MRKIITILMSIISLASFSQSIYDNCPSSGSGLNVGTTCANSTYPYNMPGNGGGSFTESTPVAGCVTSAQNIMDGWVLFTATSTNTVINVTVNGGDDLAIALYSACGTELVCSNSGLSNHLRI